ncbi:hypothetical protein [Streptomyces sp. NBC_00344]|uniref:hypothetical protein n=1 Tax=Streptomyces sp. NBC_00344 TaxID=2975720 RepID=UPI002E23EF02
MMRSCGPHLEEELDREYQWATAGVDAMHMAVVQVEEHELVWIVYWQLLNDDVPARLVAVATAELVEPLSTRYSGSREFSHTA